MSKIRSSYETLASKSQVFESMAAALIIFYAVVMKGA